MTLFLTTRRAICACALGALTVMMMATAQAAGLDEGEARRFLAQASFGPTEASTQALMASGKAAWLQQQFAQPASDFSGIVAVDVNAKIGCPEGAPPGCKRDNYSMFPLQVQFFRNALNGPDQLRQRTALALSQILVVSGQQIRLPYAMANYERIFLSHAFGNFRDILREVTLSPAMGRFLNMANNDKPNPAKGIAPNENYARELLQLFSIGLWQLNPDGSQQLDARGLPLPSYDQEVVEGFAHVFTGWSYPPRPGGRDRFPNPPNFIGPMLAYAAHHDLGAKQLLLGQTLPAGQGAAADLEAALDNVFKHPNVGPFIGRQLIQQLVTANPSPAYVARVAAAFNGSSGALGGSARGDMKATLSAILLDPEASAPPQPQNFGKLREPILQLTHLFRALGGESDGVWLRGQAAALGQPIYSPPSVFNFFPPDYDLPDDPSLDGLRCLQCQRRLPAQRDVRDRAERQGRAARRQGRRQHRQQDRPDTLAGPGGRPRGPGEGDQARAVRRPHEQQPGAGALESRAARARGQALGARPGGAVPGRHVP